MTPSEVGARAEASVAQALARTGKAVLIPLFGAHLRYDLVFSDDSGFHRVQVKAGRLRNGAIRFRACSQTNNVQQGYQDEVEFFGVYCFDLDEVYLVPIEVVPSTGVHLRLEPASNNQRKGIRWAEDYRLHPA